MQDLTFSTIQLHPFIKINEKIEYLILKRNSFSHIYPGMWQVITGKIEEGEKAYETALRELKEETGLKPVKFYHIPFIGSFYDWRKDNIENIPCFAAEIESKDILISNEHSEFKFVNFDKIFNYLELPSHQIGVEYLKKFILENKNNGNFLIRKLSYGNN